MYHPYFRGKTYELITIRESAALLKGAGFTPIIEPVKQSLGALKKTIETINKETVRAVVIVNPFHGDHSGNGENISALLKSECEGKDNIAAGILLKEETSVKEALELCDEHADLPVALIHAGFTSGKELAANLGNRLQATQNIFFEQRSSKLYQRHFTTDRRILLRDGFKRRRNRDHPPLESFSDLHVTFSGEGVTGFGDFLIVGDEYLEAGGPAYAVAIHLTFIDESKDDEMYIYHFKSDRQDTPTDPAGKFAEALEKLVQKLDEKDNRIFESDAIREFRELHARKHFPGLGYVKKLSMKHHIETLANYFDRNR